MSIEDVEAGFTSLGAEDVSAFETMSHVVQAYQREHCPAYARFGLDYLPVAAFKHVSLTTFVPDQAERVFKSSGTGRTKQSVHYVRCLKVYERAVCTHFERAIGCGPFVLLAHLPGYMQHREQSSLICMLDILIRKYGTDGSGFFLNDPGLLARAITHSKAPILLFGSAFGLLNRAEENIWALPPGARIIETGGVKTYRQEISRGDLHAKLAAGFKIPERNVLSEYGMCELLSQAYTRGGLEFYPPPWMRVHVMDPDRPERPVPEGTLGVLAFFDLANLYTVSGLLTEDLGVQRGAGFEVVGRLSGSALRGCNFLLETK